MKPNINLSVDKTVVTEGDVVEMSWACSPADAVKLTLDNGFKSNSISVEASGSKKFRLNRSKGKTYLVIEAVLDGKSYYKSVKVRVKKLKAVKADKVYDYTGVKGAKKNGFKTTWYNFKSRIHTVWNYLPAKKQVAYITLSAICLVMILSIFWPPFMSIGMLLLVVYLLFVIIRR